MWHANVVVLGFSLPNSPATTTAPPPPQPQPLLLRRLSDDYCDASCDDGEDSECDEQDAGGRMDKELRHAPYYVL
jgi:hypothetical protein